MNQVFKVIFNKAIGVFMAVSELSQNRGKHSEKSDDLTLKKLSKQNNATTNLNFKLSLVSSVVLFTLFNNTVQAEWLVVDRGSVAGKGNDSDHKIALNPNGDQWQTNSGSIGSRGVSIGHNATATGSQSVSVGAESQADGEQAVGIGFNTRAKGKQSTAVGGNSGANSQSVAVGADVYATGSSSIAIGSDDLIDGLSESNAQYNNLAAKLPDKTIQDIYKSLWEGSNPYFNNSDTVNSNTRDNNFKYKYLNNQAGSGKDNRIYSPTFAGGRGSIAIGARTVASGDLSTSIGSLSFALAPSSTTLGYLAFVNSNATGGTALGLQSRVYAANSVVVGNYSEATNQGALAYGYKAKAVGQGSLAIGNSVAANAAFRTDISSAIVDEYKKITDGIAGLVTSGVDTNSNTGVFHNFNEKFNQIFNTNAVDPNTSGLPLDVQGDEIFSIGSKSIKKLAQYRNASNAIVLGTRSFAVKNNALAIGYATLSDADNAFALGSYSYVNSRGKNSLAIGVGSYVGADDNNKNKGDLDLSNSIAFGTLASVRSKNSIAIGPFAIVGANTKDGNNTAVGYLASTGSGVTNAVSLGSSARTLGSRSVAIGNSAEANTENSVALGYRSNTDYFYVSVENSGTTTANSRSPVLKGTAGAMSASKLAGYVPRGSSYIIPVDNTAGLISVGGWNNNGGVGLRRIINAAPGALDTDVATVGQLRALEYTKTEPNVIYYTIDNNGNKVKLVYSEDKFYPVNTNNGEPLPNSKAIDPKNVFIGPKNPKADTVALNNSSGLRSNNTANDTVTSLGDALPLANVSTVTIGQGNQQGANLYLEKNKITGRNNTAELAGLTFNTNSVITLSGASNNSTAKITNLTKGTISNASTDAVNGSQLFGVKQVLGTELGGSNTTFTQPTFTAVATPTGNGTARTTFKAAIDDLIARVNAGYTFGSADTGVKHNQKLGSELLFNAKDNFDGSGDDHSRYVGDNISTSYSLNGSVGTLYLGIKTTPTFNSLTVRSGEGTYDGVSTQLTTTGLTAYGKNGNTKLSSIGFTSGTVTLAGADGTGTATLAGVTAGANDTDAVNVSQLKGLTTSLKTILGDGFTNNGTTLTAPAKSATAGTGGIGGTGENTIDGAIKWLKDNAGGKFTYKVNSGAGKETNLLDLVGDTGITVTDKGSGKVEFAAKPLTFSSDTSVGVTANLGGTVTIKAEDITKNVDSSSVKYLSKNLTTNTSQSDSAVTVGIGLIDTPTFTSVTAKNDTKSVQLTSTGLTGLSDAATQSGLTFGSNQISLVGNGNGNKVKITNVADGTATNDAVNYGQLSSVKTIADTAKSIADTAKTTADSANATAGQAKSTAETANTTANNAKDTAEQANTTASEAKNTANQANTTANQANTTAGEAKTIAGNAKTTADTAKNIADNVKTEVDKGYNFQAGSETAQNLGLGGTVKLVAGSTKEETDGSNLDIKLKKSGTTATFTIGMKKNPLFTGVSVGSANNTRLTLDSAGIKGVDGNDTVTSGFNFTDGSITAIGSTAHSMPKITNVAAGTVSNNSNDVIVGKQLYNLADNLKTLLGSTSKNTDGVVTAPEVTGDTGGIGNTGKSNISEAIDSVRSNLDTLKNNLGSTDLTYKANGNNAKNTKLNVGLNFTNGDNGNITASVADDGVVKYTLKKNLTLESITTGTNGAKTHMDSMGIHFYTANTTTPVANIGYENNTNAIKFSNGTDNIRLTGIANGRIDKTSKEAINGSQLYHSTYNLLGVPVNETDGNLSSKPEDVATATGIDGAKNIADAINKLKASLTSTVLTYKAGTNKVERSKESSSVSLNVGLTFNAGSNLYVDIQDNGAITYGLNKKLVGLTDITVGDNNKAHTTINDKGFFLYDTPSETSNDAPLAFGIKNGKGSDGSSPAVTFVGTNGTDPITLTNLKDGKIANGSRDAVTGNQLNDLATKLLGTDVNGTTFVAPTFAGVKTNANNGTGTTQTTFKQAIDDLISAVNTGYTFKGDQGNGHQLYLGATVNITGDTNITTKSTTTGVKVTLNPEIKVTSITAGSKSVLDSKGLELQEPNATIVIGGTRGTNTKPETGLQLTKSDIQSFDNGTVNAGVSFKSGQVYLTGLNFYRDENDSANLPQERTGVKLSNVAAGTLSSTSTDAVNGSQLYTSLDNLLGLEITSDKGTPLSTTPEAIKSATGLEANNIAEALKVLNTKVDDNAKNAKFYYKANSGASLYTTLEQGLDFINTDNNITINTDTGTNGKGKGQLYLELNKTLTGLTSISVGADDKKASLTGDQLYIGDTAKAHTGLNTNSLTGYGDNGQAIGSLKFENDKISLAGANGTDAITLTNLKDGKIANGSRDAVTGNQLNDLVTNVLGITPKENFSFTTPNIAPVKTGKGDQAQMYTTFDAAIKGVIKGVNQGLTFADGKSHSGTQYLGSTLTLKQGDATTGDTAKEFKGRNLYINYSLDNETKNGTYTVGIAEKPAFATLTVDNGKPVGQNMLLSSNALTFRKAGETGASSITFAENTITLANSTNNAIKLTGVADGKISEDSNDAVNGKQLHNIITKLNTLLAGIPEIPNTDNVAENKNVGGLNINDNETSVSEIVTAGAGTTIPIIDTDETADTDSTITVPTTENGGTNETVTTANNSTVAGTGELPTTGIGRTGENNFSAAIERVNTDLANAQLHYTGETGTASTGENRLLSQGLNFKNGNNITAEANTGGEIIFNLNDQLDDIQTITFKNDGGKGAPIKIDKDGITVNDTFSGNATPDFLDSLAKAMNGVPASAADGSTSAVPNKRKNVINLDDTFKLINGAGSKMSDIYVDDKGDVKIANPAKIRDGKVEVTENDANGNEVTKTYEVVKGVTGKNNQPLLVTYKPDGTPVLNASPAEAIHELSKTSNANRDAINANHNAISNLRQEFHQERSEVRAGIAGAVASASLPVISIPGKSTFSVAGGTYRGQNAVAFGISRYSDNGKIVVKITGSSNSRGNLTGGIGAGFVW